MLSLEYLKPKSDAYCGGLLEAVVPGLSALQPRAVRLCRMFTFLSQRNKKCTSLSELGVEGSVARRTAAPVDNGCCTSPISCNPTLWCRSGPGPSMALGCRRSAAARRPYRRLRNLTAVYELIARAGLTHTRPPFGIDSSMVGNREVEVHEEAAASTPFGTLLHFKKDIATAQPRVLLVAPLSGHFATLLRATVRTMLPDHDVYITDWHNARDVPLTAGRFGIDEYIDHLIKFLETIGPGAHVLAVCQPCVAALVGGRGDGADRQSGAAALDDADGRTDRHPRQPDQGQRARQQARPSNGSSAR